MQILVLWITPGEDPKATLFQRDQEDFDITDESFQHDVNFMYFGEASCAQPRFVMKFPDDAQVPPITDFEGRLIDIDVVVGELP